PASGPQSRSFPARTPAGRSGYGTSRTPDWRDAESTSRALSLGRPATPVFQAPARPLAAGEAASPTALRVSKLRAEPGWSDTGKTRPRAPPASPEALRATSLSAGR